MEEERHALCHRAENLNVWPGERIEQVEPAGLEPATSSLQS